MKKIILLGILCLSAMSYGQINFTDDNFKQALLNHSPAIDVDDNGEISIEEARSFRGKLRVPSSQISDVRELIHFIGISMLDVTGNKLTTLDITRNLGLSLVRCDNNQLRTIITGTRNAGRLKELTCRYNQLESLDTSDLTNLRILIAVNNRLTGLDLTNNEKLTELDVNDNRLNNLDITNNPMLEILGCHNQNNLRSLDVSKNSNLTVLSCNDNNLSTLNLSNNGLLRTLRIEDNQFKNLDITNNPNLEILRARNNQLSTLDVTQNIALKNLYVDSNELTSLDISNNVSLENLNVSDNRLESLDGRNNKLKRIFVRNNPQLVSLFLTGQKFAPNPNFGLTFFNNPKLLFVCVDQEYVSTTRSLLSTFQYTSTSTNPTISSNCTVVSGNVRYNPNGSSCSSDNTGFSSMKIVAFSSAGDFLEIFPNNFGQYVFEPENDTYSIFPVFENLDYFNVDPEFTSLTFPQDASLGPLNYCVSPKGNFDDLSITIVPLTIPRPGFITKYLVTVKNKGTTIQSGRANLTYQKEVLTLRNTVPTGSNSADGTISWNFTNLKPQESSEFEVSVRINAPTDNPAVNGGDVLNFQAKVAAATDETPNDNTAVFNQTVVNAFDPNDKICLEGETIAPEDVGSFLHYLIRFENTGTANATTVRVEDIIDTAKLDIESFVPLQASHDFTTVVSDKSKIEFIFNDIDLPFDDANNDGYVLFKIKTKSSLKEGDSVDNKASIFFDFNKPIITEVETVTVKKEEGSSEPSFETYFSISPNPTTGILNLTLKKSDITIQRITVQDVFGRPLGFFPGSLRTINISYLFPNTYFLNIETNKGTLTTQFIKIR